MGVALAYGSSKSFAWSAPVFASVNPVLITGIPPCNKACTLLWSIHCLQRYTDWVLLEHFELPRYSLAALAASITLCDAACAEHCFNKLRNPHVARFTTVALQNTEPRGSTVCEGNT
jgi:hypothetical protein